MCPHHRTSVSKLVLMQGNMVISCSSAFYPRTFCHAGMLFFFFFSKQELKAHPQIFCQLPIQLGFVQGSCEPDRGPDIDISCPAQSFRTCPDHVPREVEVEMPSHASQLVLCWFQPTGHLVSSPCYAHSLVWEVETFCGIQFIVVFVVVVTFFANQDAWSEQRILASVWYYVACPHIEIEAQKTKDATWQRFNEICAY